MNGNKESAAPSLGRPGRQCADVAGKIDFTHFQAKAMQGSDQ